MSDHQGIRVLPLIKIPPRPQLLVPCQGCKLKTPTAKKLPPLIYCPSSPVKKMTESVSPIHKLHSWSPQNLKPMVHEPLTPMTEKDLVYRIIQNSLFHLSFKYLDVQTIADIPKNSPEADRQIDNLCQLYFNRDNQEEKGAIAKYVMSCLVRETPKYEKPNQFSEFSPIYAIPNSQQLEKLHFLFQKIIADNPRITSKRYILQLIHMLYSNVDFERKEIEKELILILNENFSARSFVLHELLSELINFLDDSIKVPPYAVSSILRIFIHYFNNIFNGALTQKTVFIFQNIFYRLYSSEFISMFEKPLKDLSVYFMQKDPEIAKWCIEYLYLHWPISTPQKEIAFFQQIENALQFTDPNSVDSIAIKISRIMSKCIASETINVSVSAMLDLTSNSILSYFNESNKLLFLKDLIPALEITSKNWKPEVRSMAENLLEHLKAEVSFIELKAASKKAEEKRNQNWTTIRTIARSKRIVNSQKTVSHPSLDK